MAGKNAKRRAKAAKAGIRSLEMPKELWRMMANVTTMATTMGASESVAERCRKLAARAEYYLGEPENKTGRVRGELTRDEWAAYRDLVNELRDASAPVKALAQAIEGIEEEEDAIIHNVVDLRETDSQAKRDAAVVCQPDSLQLIIATLQMMSMMGQQKAPLSSEAQAALAQIENMEGGVSAAQYQKDMIACAKSAMTKLSAIRDTMLKAKGVLHFPLKLSLMEATTVYSALRAFRETVKVNVKAPPEYADQAVDMDRILSCAVRFFARMAGGDDDVMKELQ